MTGAAPSAAQLAVLERLAARRTTVGPGLTDLVLTTPVGGRGPVDGSVLDWHGQPVAPSERELLRVCIAVLSRCFELDASSSGAEARVRRRSWRRSWGRARGRAWGRRGSSPVVIGTSPQAHALRKSCRGLRVAGPAPVLVVGGTLEAMAAGLWRQRVESGSGVRWRRLWEGFVARDRLPDALDPARQAAQWRERPGRVHVLLAGPGEELPDVAELLGADPVAPRDRLDTVDTDLLRRLNQSLATRPEPVRRRPYDGAPATCFDRPWTGEPGLPAPTLAWAVTQAAHVARAIADCGATVHGDPAVVVPSTRRDVPRSVPVADTLERALEVLSTQFEGGERWRAR